MKNYVQHGDTLTLTAPSGGVVGGAAYLIGAALFGVAVGSASEGEPFELRRRGVFTLPKAAGAAWAEGDALYWDNTAKNVTKTSSGNTLIGAAVAAAQSGDNSGAVLLNQH